MCFASIFRTRIHLLSPVTTHRNSCRDKELRKLREIFDIWVHLYTTPVTIYMRPLSVVVRYCRYRGVRRRRKIASTAGANRLREGRKSRLVRRKIRTYVKSNVQIQPRKNHATTGWKTYLQKTNAKNISCWRPAAPDHRSGFASCAQYPVEAAAALPRFHVKLHQVALS